MAVVTAVAVVSMVLGAVASRFIVSPGDAAARARAPEASQIAVPVERRQLVSRVVTRGEIALGDAVGLSIPSVDGAVVTERPPAAGSVLAEGDVLVEVSERPVFVLAGAIPMYRDVLPGSTGADVEQLERALQRLGFDPGVVDEDFDAATERGLAALYEARGHLPPDPPPEDLARLDEARQRLVAAQAAVAESGGTGAAEAEVDLRDAQRALASAQGAATTAVQEADGALGTASAAAAVAQQAEGSAVAALEAARGNGSPADEVRELELAAGSARVERVAADNGLALASTQRDQVAADAQAAIDAAADQVALAQTRLAAVEASTGAAAPPAQTELDAAKADLAEVEAQVGTPALRAELIFVPTLPATVSSVEVRLGSVVDGVIAEVSQATIEARTVIPERAQDLVTTGASVTVTSADDSFEAEGTIVAIASEADEAGAYPARVALDAQGLDALEVQGASVRITIPIGQTDGPVLVVPVSALFSTADGTARVEVAEAHGDDTHQVAVVPGLSADGYVEIAVEDSALKEGDLVVVGRED